MIEVRWAVPFGDWLRRLRDRGARSRILARLDRIAIGDLGETRSVGSGIHEIKIDHGPGYRIYFVYRSAMVIVLLCGGDKSSQARDIEAAKQLAKELDDES